MSAIVEKDTYTEQSQCNKCVYQIKANECLAFKKIPIEIIENIKKHNKVLSGQDYDVFFTPKKNGQAQ